MDHQKNHNRKTSSKTQNICHSGEKDNKKEASHAAHKKKTGREVTFGISHVIIDLQYTIRGNTEPDQVDADIPSELDT